MIACISRGERHSVVAIAMAKNYRTLGASPQRMRMENQPNCSFECLRPTASEIDLRTWIIELSSHPLRQFDLRTAHIPAGRTHDEIIEEAAAKGFPYRPAVVYDTGGVRASARLQQHPRCRVRLRARSAHQERASIVDERNPTPSTSPAPHPTSWSIL